MVQVNQKNNSRSKLLRALFAKCRDQGIDAEFLRDEIAPVVIKKRLSEASSNDLIKVLEHITGNSSVKRGTARYPSSKAGLLQELEDTARIRWGIDFTKSLNAFVNANRKTGTHYRFLSVTALKGVKERLIELNKKDGK